MIPSRVREIRGQHKVHLYEVNEELTGSQTLKVRPEGGKAQDVS